MQATASPCDHGDMDQIGRVAVVFVIAFAAGFFVGHWSAGGFSAEPTVEVAPATPASAPSAE